MGEEPLYQILQVSKRFGDKLVLSDVNLSMEKGKCYCLMGVSGAGKTTLLSILMGSVRADSGEIRGFSRKKMGVVFQEDRLLEEENAVENVALVCNNKVNKEEIKKLLLELLSVEDLNKPIREYSGGMKRRVALCRALAAPSDLLLLDEPFTGLDQENRERAASFILRHQGERTVLAVTHQPEDAQLLDAKILKL